MTSSYGRTLCSQYNYVIEEHLMTWKNAQSTMLNEKGKGIKQDVQDDPILVKKKDVILSI